MAENETPRGEEPAADGAEAGAVEVGGPEPETGSAHSITAKQPRRRHRGATTLIGALLAILGFAIAIQVRSNSSGDALSSAREEDLVRILDDQNSRLDRLQDQLSSLQAAKQKLTDTGNNAAEARAEAQRQADALAILNGTAPAHGPGIDITITDPEHKLAAEDLLDVIEELRGAGAEVIQFGSVRVSTSTAFTNSAGGVFLDGTALSAPYRVLAIGEPATMNTALNIVGGVVNTVQQAGGKVTVVQKSAISITATRPVTQPKYATTKPG